MGAGTMRGAEPARAGGHRPAELRRRSAARQSGQLRAFQHRVPGEEIGRRAALLLERMLGGEDLAGQVHRVPPLELHVRDSSDPAATGDPVLARAMGFIRDRLGGDCQVDEIARAAGVSRRALELRFRDKIHTSVHAHVLELRMALACTLIRNTRHGFEEIAERCGFASPATFSRAFRARFGHPPSTLRKR